MFCPRCWSFSRNRFVAKAVIEEIINHRRSLVNLYKDSHVKILNTDKDDAISRQLKGNPNFIRSVHLPQIETGFEIENGLFCQNLERMTFYDETFDVVITQDVFEHIRDDGAAFREIFRALKPGGAHVFTVPFDFDRPTLVRVDTTGEEDIHITEPEYHDDPVAGTIIAYRTYGVGLTEMMGNIGFETEVFTAQPNDKASGIYDGCVFISKKPFCQARI